MSAVQNTYDSVKRPKGFSLKQFIDDGGMGFGEATPINLVARISPMLARELEETKSSANQRIKPDGDWFRIQAIVQDTWQLKWWLLAKMEDIEVLEPTSLRETISEVLNRAILNYKGN